MPRPWRACTPFVNSGAAARACFSPLTPAPGQGGVPARQGAGGGGRSALGGRRAGYSVQSSGRGRGFGGPTVGTWVASAPGKVVLLGEYAVLDGAPALVQAVNRRCTVRLSLCAQDHARIEAVQLGRAHV